ncbi:hypothetical protein VNO78_07931 [Psophocarpus tetragonolobus]|uniref:Uncharacterized protein n=1 Tax=Psophocarpus tetragonolobus TaxID=3891 RepID=A0AAN9T444_PSOTE
MKKKEVRCVGHRGRGTDAHVWFSGCPVSTNEEFGIYKGHDMILFIVGVLFHVKEVRGLGDAALADSVSQLLYVMLLSIRKSKKKRTHSRRLRGSDQQNDHPEKGHKTFYENSKIVRERKNDRDVKLYVIDT